MDAFARPSRRGLFAALSLALAASLPLAASAGTASGTASVSATVVNNCVFGTNSVAFGNYDAVAANKTSALTANGTVNVTCTQGDAYAISADAGANGPHAGTGFTRAMSYTTGGGTPTTYYLNYELYTDSGLTTVWNGTNTLSGTGSGASQAVTFYGAVGSGQGAVPAAAYADTVNLSVTF
ncbi:MAG TPA: spore coat U domain-containing protein [Candidatus Elarobacter sp.]|jgi:spore coat protein U-like protein|nr:spore coat U domain-containing protein [Candidatus Elarobacter sp.]